jgi:hypothetical protein
MASAWRRVVKTRNTLLLLLVSAEAALCPDNKPTPSEPVTSSDVSTIVLEQVHNATAGKPITPAVRVTAMTASGKVATGFTGSVTLGIGTFPSGLTAAPTLAGTTTVSAVAGVDTFPDLVITQAGSGFSFTASSPGLAKATSNTFVVDPGPAASIQFVGMPSSAKAGVPFTFQIRAIDAFQNTATSYTGTAGVSLVNASAGTMTGTTAAVAVNGVATLSVSLNPAGASLTMRGFYAGSSTITATVVVSP